MYQNTRRFKSNAQLFMQRSTRFAPKRQIDVSMYIKKAKKVTEETIYTPTHQFSEFPFIPQLKQNILHHGYNTPTPIQDKAIPEVVNDRDVVGIANTGTGKTAAFLLPLINKAALDGSQNVLIIAPTRELALQIQEEFKAFSRGLNLFSVLCIGGVNIRRQMYDLRRSSRFVIGTPGRLRDLEKQGELTFSGFNNIVLDEVDRMLDMGFIKDINYIVGKLPQQRQSLFFSATIPDSLKMTMQRFLHNPVTVAVHAQRSSENVNQDIIKTNGKQKIEVLHELLLQEDFRKVLLFGRTKWGVEKLSRELGKRGFKVVSIHGDKKQSQRQRALEEFKRNKVQVLLATDIASRGLDVPDVSHVINYDLPESYEDYIHRIGRTGRAQKTGTALTFVD